MADDSQKARAARAQSIRKRIDELNTPPASVPPGEKESKPPPESPAEFIHRKMQDWEAKK